MNKTLTLLFLLFSAPGLWSQSIESPLVKNGYSRPSKYDEISAFVKDLNKINAAVSTEILGQSIQGRNVYAVKFSSSSFGKDPSRIKVLIFAQQHGNEQSGKEGALRLIGELLKPENAYLLKKMDIAIIPQVNPDGSESNTRRNGNRMDLNRNHMILTEPETQALHRFFNRYLFDVTVDCHEYSPYGESGKAYGYRNNSDLLLGCATNTNVSEKIRKLENEEYVPYLRNYLSARGVSSFIYSPGGPPEEDYIRHSTFDVNDGRQSLAIQNSFSFIHEGLNGTDGFSDNIKHRAESQMHGMRGLIEFTYLNAEKIKKLVSSGRESIISAGACQVGIQSLHTADGSRLHLPLLSYSTGKDTIVVVSDYRPVVKSIFDVIRPEGYLVPKNISSLTDWITRQEFKTAELKPISGYQVEGYFIRAVDSIDFEGDRVVNPSYHVKENLQGIDPEAYVFLPAAQLRGNFLVLALEPKSMLGLVTYSQFAGLLKPGELFPVLRVIKKK